MYIRLTQSVSGETDMKKRVLLSVIACLTMIPCAMAQEVDSVMDSKMMLTSAEQAVTRVETVIAEAQTKLSEAREASDVAQMDCINAQLVNARGFLNVVQNGESNLKDAVSRNDQAAQHHHFKLVQLALSKVEAIENRISECISGIIGLSSETSMETTRTCKVEPCLGDETYYDPGHAESLLSGSVTDSPVDASPYL